MLTSTLTHTEVKAAAARLIDLHKGGNVHALGSMTEFLAATTDRLDRQQIRTAIIHCERYDRVRREEADYDRAEYGLLTQGIHF